MNCKQILEAIIDIMEDSQLSETAKYQLIEDLLINKSDIIFDE